MTRLMDADYRTLLPEPAKRFLLPFGTAPTKILPALRRSRDESATLRLECGVHFVDPYICRLSQIGGTMMRSQGVHSIAATRRSF